MHVVRAAASRPSHSPLTSQNVRALRVEREVSGVGLEGFRRVNATGWVGPKLSNSGPRTAAGSGSLLCFARVPPSHRTDAHARPGPALIRRRPECELGGDEATTATAALFKSATRNSKVTVPHS